LYVVGIGPGSAADRTRRAEAAIAASDVVVGYAKYLAHVKDLCAGKELVSSGMKEEVERCRHALELAQAGRVVSLISSGDAGVYGMAGLAIELACSTGILPVSLQFPAVSSSPEQQKQQDMGKMPMLHEDAGETPAPQRCAIDIEIVPGVTAASAAAARMGAPLMLDFAVISLSDLLVPWETIRRRVEAVAAADMVLALYNPRSTKRVRQLEETVEILLRHRADSTPVGIGRAVGSEDEHIQITTLGRLLGEQVDMRTVLIVGNSMSRALDGWFITSRGYHI
jgi:precorrin-3B methylase